MLYRIFVPPTDVPYTEPPTLDESVMFSSFAWNGAAFGDECDDDDELECV
jgi:hypothetical protein